MTTPGLFRTAPLAAMLLLAGCCGGAARTASARPAPAAPGAAAYRWAGRKEVGQAIQLLDAGEADKARTLLARVARRQPDDAIATSLLKQIDGDPRALLGAESFPYVSRARESFAMIAQRFLGDPNLFYALARYNGFVVPGKLQAGTTLRIPGREKRDAPPPPPREPPAAAAPAKPAAPAVVVAPANDPQTAAKLRGAGLEQLNRGAIARAVLLLEQASRLDPANPLIRRDLERAVRIRRTVQNGR